ncbi:MAG: hypothetical protein ACUVQU_00225 [Candidatus Bipolaricaulia bacterium]
MEEKEPRAGERPIAAFVLALLAGLWMVAVGSMSMMTRSGFIGWGWGAGGMGWMWGHGMMGGFGGFASPPLWWPWLGLIAGIIVLIGTAMIYAKPAQSQGWGIAILVASALNLFLGMGGLLASLLGLVGGALALIR